MMLDELGGSNVVGIAVGVTVVLLVLIVCAAMAIFFFRKSVLDTMSHLFSASLLINNIKYGQLLYAKINCIRILVNTTHFQFVMFLICIVNEKIYIFRWVLLLLDTGAEHSR